MVGYFSILLALAASGIAVFYFYNAHSAYSHRRSGKSSHTNALTWYNISAGISGIAALYLLYIILANQFQFAYVYSYSSRDLSLAYKLSAFWAGQEGSFMLWLVFHVLFGLVLARQKTTAPGTMTTYSLVQCILLTFLLIKSPFMMLSELPYDGNGLNPLLQDPWMVIHPPVVFLGYAGLAIPFAYAINGLLTNEHREWVDKALPWTLLSWSALGAGIFIGGFWAYKVLGWGGYWAWDPVENSSLVPWLAAGALIHCLLLARIRATGIKPTYVGALFTYVLVLYGTYLTRSGILSDFSTHSFADEGIGGLLGAVVLLILMASLVLLITKWPSLPQGEIYPKAGSREFILACTALVFAVLTALVFIGMSTPLFTLLLGSPQSVSTAFYNSTSLPLALAMAVLLTVGPLYKWGGSNHDLSKAVTAAGVITAISLVGAYWMGLRNPMMLLIVAFSVAAFTLNLFAALSRRFTVPAAVTHLGVAVALVGIIVSSVLGRADVISFNKGETKTVLGKSLTFLGVEESQAVKGFYHRFKLQDGMSTYDVDPFTKQNKEGKEAAREPGIHRGLMGDLYLAPIHKHESEPVKELILKKGEQTAEGPLTIKFIRFSMNNDGNNEIKVQAFFEVTKEGKTEEVSPEFVYRNGQSKGFPVKAFDGAYQFMLGGVNPNGGQVKLGVKEVAPVVQDTQVTKVDVDISEKPLINLVWLGTGLITVGTAWGGVIRFKK